MTKVPVISVMETEKLLSQQLVFGANVLTADWFIKQGRRLLPGTRWIPAPTLLSTLEKSGVSKDAPIILYCASPSCPASGEAGEVLLKQGYKNVKVFEGGLEAWEQAALPFTRLDEEVQGKAKAVGCGC